MHKNSLDTYDQIKSNLTRAQLSVAGAMQQIGKPATMHQIADYMRVPLNVISGRFGELRDNKVIKAFDTVYYKPPGAPRKYPRTRWILCKCEHKQAITSDVTIFFTKT